MNKIVFVLVVLVLAAFPATVYAGDGIINNPNHFDIDMHCGNETIPATIPTSSGVTPGFTDDGRVVHPRTFMIDFESDGVWDLKVVLSKAQGFDTVFCTWTWDRDQYRYGMDVWFVSAK